MITDELNDIEIAPPSVVAQAARDFAAALAETDAFMQFEAAAKRFHHDATAKQAQEALQSKHQSLQMLMKLNAVSPEDRAELQRLQEAFLSQPSVQAYFEAQAAFQAVCQATGNILSQSTGLSFASACGGGCCG